MKLKKIYVGLRFVWSLRLSYQNVIYELTIYCVQKISTINIMKLIKEILLYL